MLRIPPFHGDAVVNQQAPLPPSPAGSPDDGGYAQPDILRIAAGLLSAAIVVAALYLGRDVLLPLAVAFLISFALYPVVSRLGKLGVTRILSVIVVMTMVIAFLGAMGLLLATQVRSLSEELPTYRSTIHSKLVGLRQQMEGPGIVRQALDAIGNGKEEKEEKPQPGPSANAEATQRIEVVQPPQSPFRTALEWLVPALEPLATAGIVFVFVFLALLDRSDLRDRLLRLLGGNLHRSTAAMEEAGTRISKYLLMQLLVNVSYGVPMAAGLWFIGVPGALLWGTVAAVMRFIPYIGPMISAIFPLALAFAVDPGWNMVLMTAALIVVLELVSNNVVEPLLYGSSTGLSALSLIVAATFWTLLWGPVGLVLSTPLTVCLLVVGRNLPQLQFLETLLGSTPVLDVPTRIYQRLIADDPEEAIDIATVEIEKTSLTAFYNDTGIAILRLASADHARSATAEHRLRVATGMDELLDDLREEYPAANTTPERVVCIGGKWEIDAVAGEMLAHALSHAGVAAGSRPASAAILRHVDRLDLDGAEIVCLGYFSNHPAISARQFCRRLRQRWPHVRIVLALWNAPPELLEDDAHRQLGADELVTSVEEAIGRVRRMLAPEEALAERKAEPPADDAARIVALRDSGVLDGRVREELDALAKRAADVFNVGFAVISAIDAEREFIIGQSKELPGMKTADGTDMIVMPREDAVCDHVVSGGETLVVPDTERDPRFADHPAITLWDTRFYAGAPLLTEDGHVLGALCLLDTRPHSLTDKEAELLAELAADVASIITGADAGDITPATGEDEASATVGQKVPEG